MEEPHLQFKVILRHEMQKDFITYYPFLSGILQAHHCSFSCAKVEVGSWYLVMSGIDSYPDFEVSLPHEFVLYYLSLGKITIHGFDVSQFARVENH